MTTEGQKKPWQSKTVVSGFFLLLIGLLELFGVPITDEIRAILTGDSFHSNLAEADSIQGLLKVLFGAAVMWFRATAKKTVEGVVDSGKGVLQSALDWVKGLFKK